MLWADLEYSGILDLVSPSFYPLQVPEPAERTESGGLGRRSGERLHGGVWQHDLDGSNLAVAGFLSDVHNPGGAARAAENLSRAATDADARKLAHQFADDIIGVLSGGLPGIAQTQIAYVSGKTGNKEIWVMDYDGANQHQVSHLKSISLTPRWSPDATRIAFTCYEPFRGVTSAQICIYSTASDRHDCISAVSRNEQLARMVARRLADWRLCRARAATRRFSCPIPAARTFIASRLRQASALRPRGIPRQASKLFL